MGKVDLGFVDECDDCWLLESRFFPSKVGGKPAWLDLKDIPDDKAVECDYCSEPCIFLCQIYAPYEDSHSAFHRTIFVFTCKNAECCRANENGNVKVLRSQLEKVNEFYPSEPPEEKQDWRCDIVVDKWTSSCHVCGLKAPKRCGKCKSVNYCCRSHQVNDWEKGHKKQCGQTENFQAKNDHLFPEYELAIESEESEIERDEVERESEEIEKFKELVEAGQAGTLQSENDVDADLVAMSNQVEDETFAEFQARIKKYPDQVLRYDRGGSPLYISAENQPSDIPDCGECGGPRHFEFQIMPQLLNYLKFEDTLKSLDWGILAAFTCAKSCTPTAGYVKEFMWKQDIVQDTPS